MVYFHLQLSLIGPTELKITHFLSSRINSYVDELYRQINIDKRLRNHSDFV